MEGQCEQEAQCAEGVHSSSVRGLVAVARPASILHLVVWNRNIIWTLVSQTVTHLTNRDQTVRQQTERHCDRGVCVSKKQETIYFIFLSVCFNRCVQLNALLHTYMCLIAFDSAT